MHLALVTHRVRTGDGQGRVNFEVARYGLERGARVTLVAHEVAPELLEAGAEWVQVSLRVERPELVKAVEFARRADRVLAARGDRYDLVCANGFVLSTRHDVNCVHFVHNSWLSVGFRAGRAARASGGGAAAFTGLYQLGYTVLNARLERLTLGRARRLVAVSEQVRSELKALGFAEDRIVTIPNGVDPDEFRPGPEDRRLLGLPDAPVPLALFVGDLRPGVKNLDTVLRALVQVPGMHLAVAGRLAHSHYPSMARALGVADRVHFLGYRNDVPRLMRAADVFVLPSRYEPFGLVLLEAMASGLPVITTRSAGASDLMTPECAFLMQDPEDKEELARIFSLLWQDTSLRARMGQAARRTAEAHTWSKVAAAYWRLFEEMRCGVSS